MAHDRLQEEVTSSCRWRGRAGGSGALTGLPGPVSVGRTTTGAIVPPGGVTCPVNGRQTRGVDVLVTGGTGRLGRRLAGPLQAAGHTVRSMSRRGTGAGGVRGDLATGRDVPLALAGPTWWSTPPPTPAA